MSLSRRSFLRTTLGSSALLSMGLDVPGFLARSAVAAGSGDSTGKVLVVVQLSGGNDGLNTVIPYSDENYVRNRTALRIAGGQVLTVNGQIGLHPAMTGFARLVEEGRLGIVQGVGYPNPDRSHFRSMDIWHSCRPDLETPPDGWLGRALDIAPKSEGQDVPALHLGPDELPLALMSGRTAVPSVDSLETFRLRTESGAVAVQALAQLAKQRGEDPPLLDFLRRSTLNAYASSDQVQAALKDEASPIEYPAYGLATKLKSVAQLIDAGLSTRIYYVSLDGFDTHSNQLDAHAGLLREVSDSIAAFVDDLVHRGQIDRVAVMTFSEFGRRVKENASAGTDHGAAAPLFLAGGGVVSDVVGAHPSLTDLDDGDLKHHTDFRQVYAALLDGWLGCSSETVLGGRFQPAAVLRG